MAGFSYYEGALHFSKLEIGTSLRIVWEKDNPYHENALALYFGDSKLRFVPKASNATISKIIQSGYEIFECVVSRLDPTEHPENQE
ncbi:MAG: hypothetical protein JJT78_16600 [Leptospira sp.]|nr:hypothetical protein [Leptospira sp.]